jgi:hypothetical protein
LAAVKKLKSPFRKISFVAKEREREKKKKKWKQRQINGTKKKTENVRKR